MRAPPDRPNRSMNSLAEVSVGYLEKVYTPLIEASSEILMQVGMELFGMLEANLVEHAPKIDNATDFLMWAAWISHQGSNG